MIDQQHRRRTREAVAYEPTSRAVDQPVGSHQSTQQRPGPVREAHHIHPPSLRGKGDQSTQGLPARRAIASSGGSSKGGLPKHPGWYHNLRAYPDTTVQIGCERRAVRARVASRDERARLWPKAVATYGGYRGYQERTNREIPLVILEPRG